MQRRIRILKSFSQTANLIACSAKIRLWIFVKIGSVVLKKK